MNNPQKSKVITMFILAIVAGVTSLLVLFNVQIYTTYAIWKTPKITVKKEVITAQRGNIYDKNGKILVSNNQDGTRYYPQNSAVHVLGVLNSSGVAQSGVELEYNDYLTGKDGEVILEYTTYKGETTLTNETVFPAENGNDIYLTIDLSMQQKAEEILSNAIYNYENTIHYGDYSPPMASAGAITVLNSQTGEVLAMASGPDYQIEKFSENYDEISTSANSPMLNRALQGLYRPGSTMKTVTAISALSEGAINSNTSFFCRGEYNYNGNEFSCMNKHRFVNVNKALDLSCNIFFYKTSLKLGIYNLNSYQTMFGFGEGLDFDLPTYSGQLASPKTFALAGEQWSDSQLLQTAIGQSKTSCTPLQMASQAQTIASRGERLLPTLILKIVDSQGNEVYSNSVTTLSWVRNNNNAFEQCVQGMVSSTQYTYGDYSLSSLPASVAIKTGTPQSPRGYDSAVVGIYPAYNSQISFSVMLEGGSNAKNTVRGIIQSYLDSE